MSIKVFDKLTLHHLAARFGAMLRIEPLSKQETLDLIQQSGGIDLVKPHPFTSDKITGALGIPHARRPTIEIGDSFIVAEPIDYRTVYFYRVTFFADGSGITADGEEVIPSPNGNDPFEE